MSPVRLGDVVRYQLTLGDVETLQSTAARAAYPHQLGDVLPLLVCLVRREGAGARPLLDGQVFLWGGGTLWVAHRHEGTEPGTWRPLEAPETHEEVT